MSANTTIAWTDMSWNPIRGCSRVSSGCKHCYAESLAGRFSGRGQPYEGLVRKTTTGFRWTGFVALISKDLDLPLRWKKPRRIFVASMSDPFHGGVPDAFLDQMFAVMALADQHQFQLLTKRPERMRAYLSDADLPQRLRHIAVPHSNGSNSYLGQTFATTPGCWPLPHLWCGVSVENQATADQRIPWLLQTPAVVRFVSYEPALEVVHFNMLADGSWHDPEGAQYYDALRGTSWWSNGDHGVAGPGLDWIICGGESGPKARPCEVAWLRNTVQECQVAGVACFVKQLGSYPRGWSGLQFVHDRKGADPSEWPDDLRVQQFPACALVASCAHF